MNLLLTQGNALRIPLADESVHCVVTSPPYWGLRKYSGTQSFVWGGDAKCAHEWVDHFKPPSGGRNLPDNMPNTGGNKTQQIVENPSRDGVHSGYCSKCGAWYGELGLEPTPEEYVANMVAVFREVKRVLRADGTCWLNLGDSYWGGGRGGNEPKTSENWKPEYGHPSWKHGSLKPKDLCGIPWRVAFALQADGWWLRSDIIWSKPNPMPESVTDRPTKAHEYLFLLTKSARYYYDADAVREALQESSIERGYSKAYMDGATRKMKLSPNEVRAKGNWRTSENAYIPSGRNRRTVWQIATAPYSGAHFATYPPALVEPCIKAGTSEHGVCPECGAPWERVVEHANDGTRKH